MNQSEIGEIWSRAYHRCEYCHISYLHYRVPFQIDHIIAKQHCGLTVLRNLALACYHCNRFKGPNIAGLDPVSGEIVRLFHPRKDRWEDHLRFEGARIAGLSPIGRATVEVLAMNREDLYRLRVELLKEGIVLS